MLRPRNVPDSAVLWRSLALLATRQPVHNGRRLSVQLKAEKAGKMGKSLAVIRILVVDDYQPFMRFVRATLQERPELQVIAEAADGLQAVQKAAALKPDLILLDIGLPTLNGIEAARQIRNVSPKSKIIFVSQECSTAVAQEALSFGARGYVVKTRAAMDLPAAVEAVLKGRHFVSGGLFGLDFTDTSSRPPTAH